MSIRTGSRLYFDHSWGMFVGAFTDNFPHRHYAVQISIAADSPLLITDAGHISRSYSACIIRPEVMHRLQCDGPHLIILINPASSLGHYFSHLADQDIAAFQHPLVIRLQHSVQDFIQEKQDFDTTIRIIRDVLEQQRCACENANHFGDDRIQKAVAYLEQHYDRVVPLQEAAALCFLSPDRFLHLFREKAGVTYRRAQLWNRISRSVPSLFRQSITETAHEYGFTDSAHYNKVFKQTFGFSPVLFAQL